MAENQNDLQRRPQPIQIVSFENHKINLQNFNDVQRILESDELKNRRAVVVSIAGALRQGKSFLLNFFLKYLKARYKQHNVTDLIGRNNNDDNLNGFSWRSGKTRETIGIWMWSEIFTHDFSDDDKVAIILMDTQGIFDNKSSLNECISIFSISMLLSSVQCYNVNRQLQEDDLSNLQLFTGYAEFVMRNMNEKPFQKLLFIVRDWSSPIDHDFGPSKEYVEDLLVKSADQTTDMHELRDTIKNSFEEIDAFLMPYPGKAVAQSKYFLGKVMDIDTEFVECVENLTERLFTPENLIRKKLLGEMVLAADFARCLKKYVEIFSGDEIPKPITQMEGIADAYFNILCNKYLNEYLNEMYQAVTNDNAQSSDDDVRQMHFEAKEKAIKQFKENPKFGGPDPQLNYMAMLEDEIDNHYKEYCKKRAKERQNTKSIKNIILGAVTSGAAILGGVVSLFVAPPIGVGLLPGIFSVAGAASTGASIGVSIASAINAFIPERKFFDTFRRKKSNNVQQCTSVPSIDSSTSPDQNHDTK